MAVKKTTKKKKAKAKKAEAPPDLRASLAPTPANLKATLAAVGEALKGLPAPAEPGPGELVEAMFHITMAQGVPCGIGQECRRRFREGFVDRNELRLTEAFEIEDLVADLEIPRAFPRCLAARDSVFEIYNDQNDVTLEFLRELSITDRNLFFQRVPVIKPHVIHFITAVLSFEELIFSERSTVRLQQRMGFDPKNKSTQEFLGQLRQMLAPYGHLPLDLGPDSGDGRPILKPELSPAGLLSRLAPPLRGGK